jgi:hypothetical protein
MSNNHHFLPLHYRYKLRGQGFYLMQSNYFLWKTQAMSLTERQEMLGFLNGDFPMPKKYISDKNAEGAGDKLLSENPDYNTFGNDQIACFRAGLRAL